MVPIGTPAILMTCFGRRKLNPRASADEIANHFTKSERKVGFDFFLIAHQSMLVAEVDLHLSPSAEDP